MTKYIYTHKDAKGTSKITVQTDSELKAAISFNDICRKFFPHKLGLRWTRTEEHEAQPQPRKYPVKEKKQLTRREKEILASVYRFNFK